MVSLSAYLLRTYILWIPRELWTWCINDNFDKTANTKHIILHFSATFSRLRKTYQSECLNNTEPVGRWDLKYFCFVTTSLTNASFSKNCFLYLLTFCTAVKCIFEYPTSEIRLQRIIVCCHNMYLRPQFTSRLIGFRLQLAWFLLARRQSRRSMQVDDGGRGEAAGSVTRTVVDEWSVWRARTRSVTRFPPRRPAVHVPTT